MAVIQEHLIMNDHPVCLLGRFIFLGLVLVVPSAEPGTWTSVLEEPEPTILADEKIEAKGFKVQDARHHVHFIHRGKHNLFT